LNRLIFARAEKVQQLKKYSIDDDEIDAGSFKYPGHAAGIKLQDHMADWDAARGSYLFEAIRFHSVHYCLLPDI
jgi:hypothetical protein